jgi:hypothetical protein
VSIKAKQVAGVTSLVVAVVMALSAYHMTTLARLNIEDTASRGQMLKNAIFQRAKGRGRAWSRRSVRGAARGWRDPVDHQLRQRVFQNVGYVAIVNKDGLAIVSSLPQLVGQPIPVAGRAGAAGLPAVGHRASSPAASRRLFRSDLRDQRADGRRGKRPGVRFDPHRRVDDAAERGAERGDAECGGGGARRIDTGVGGRDAVVAVDAAADSRDPERSFAAGTR